MREDLQSFIKSCVIVMIRPIVGFCIARGLHFQDFVILAKQAFIDSAQKMLKDDGKEISVSRVSIMTGIQRAEVNRIRRGVEEHNNKDFIVKVIGHWTSSKKFSHNKKPRKLSFEGAQSQFASLVSSVSKDLNPHTVRFELQRLGLVSCIDGKVELLSKVYITQGDPKNTLRLGSLDVEDLIICLQENAFLDHSIPNLQARTEYDNVPIEALQEIRKWFLDAGSEFHDNARRFLSTYDRDINNIQSSKSGKARVVIGTYSRVQILDEDKGPN